MRRPPRFRAFGPVPFAAGLAFFSRRRRRLRPRSGPWCRRTSTMSLSRSEEMHRLTENVYKTIMEQFNPSLRNFIAMGKNYEKALAGVTYAAKGYFDALVKMGELASESQGSKELAPRVASVSGMWWYSSRGPVNTAAAHTRSPPFAISLLSCTR
uniref:BAR/IMD domain containing adaptor protein 2 n=1 Tax=Equus asinus TaxID=9793 RepID=A0A9L0IG90_EQUAS